MKEYRVGIIGMGFIGKVHAYAYNNLPLFYNTPYRARITHVCTSRDESAERGRALFNADVATTRFREITENPDIDIVNICTPNHLHREQLDSAIAHNKHIYCDKPLVSNMTEAREIEERLKRYTGIGRMTFQNRFWPATMRAKQLVDEGFVGDVLEFRADFLHSGSSSPAAPLKWKLSGELGGGVIADLGSHILDLVHHLLGDFAQVMAQSKIAYPQRPSVDDPQKLVDVDAEDCVMALAKLKSGAIGTVSASKIATGTEDELRFEIHGTKGALRFNSVAPQFLEAYDAAQPSSPIGGTKGWTRIDCGQRYPAPAGFPTPKAAIGWMRTHMACLYDFMEAVHNDDRESVGLQQGVYIQQLMECIRNSNKLSSWVKVG